MDGTPPARVADCVEALGQHLLSKAATARQRWPGQGLPALVPSLLIAEADVTILERAPPARGQREPVNLPAQGVQHPLRALQGRCAGDAPPLGPPRRR